jgi:hypothetical protein
VAIEHVGECCRPVRGRNPAEGPVGDGRSVRAAPRPHSR